MIKRNGWRTTRLLDSPAKNYANIVQRIDVILAAARDNGIEPSAVTITIGDACFSADKFPPSYVYFLQCQEFVKIGVSKNPCRRLDEMVTGNPHEVDMILAIPGTGDDELALHEAFSAFRHRREWFRFEGELKDWIEARL